MTSGAARARRARGALLVAGALVATCPLLAGACGARSANDTYGALPKYLPASSLHPDSVLTGRASRPALTSEGDSVEVLLAQGRVLATVTGPQVPGGGFAYQTPATTCTWTLTFTGASGQVPIRISDFTTIDDRGVEYHPVLVPGQPAPPAAVAPGRTVTFELRTVMPTGEGRLRWSPGAGRTGLGETGRGQTGPRQTGPGRMVAQWDFVIETD